MRSKPFPMNPEDLDKYDPEGEANAGLRTALRHADYLNARGVYKLLMGRSLDDRTAGFRER